MKNLSKSLAVAAIAVAPMTTHAATFTYNGTLTECGGACALFSEVGRSLSASFDIDPDPMAGDTLTDGGAATNIVIELESSAGGSLAFVDGTVDAINLTTDTNGILGGTVTITGTGATTGIVATSIIDVAAGTFSALVSGTQIAAGDGAFAATPLVGAPPPPPPPPAVPVPAAAWLFGSALLGLAGVRRRA